MKYFIYILIIKNKLIILSKTNIYYQILADSKIGYQKYDIL